VHSVYVQPVVALVGAAASFMRVHWHLDASGPRPAGQVRKRRNAVTSYTARETDQPLLDRVSHDACSPGNVQRVRPTKHRC
jgi:hypothetical protein